MRHQTTNRSLGLATLVLLGVWAVAVSGEPSGGSGAGRNRTGTADGARAAADESPWPEPDQKAIAKLKEELRAQLGEAFQIIQAGPFIVATDLSAEEAPRFTKYTIASYAAAIQRQLFTAHPRSEPVKVYLFRDKESYDTWNQKLFGEKPNTPYGYYSRHHNAMVMNIGTGGGTLLHEMVHAMAEPDFPEIPAWLNEGLGSLFEQASQRGRKIIGITNWRLTGLQESLKKGTATKVKDLLAMSDAQFYGARSGQNYAAARYLMQYLQEQGKLEEFYTRIRDKKDADALTTLRGVFGNKQTVEQIEEACYTWVKTLKF